MIAQELEVSLHMAFVEARQQRHEFITVEHLLLALLDNPSAAEVLRACSANIDDLRESPALAITEALARETGATVLAVEPYVEICPPRLATMCMVRKGLTPGMVSRTCVQVIPSVLRHTSRRLPDCGSPPITHMALSCTSQPETCRPSHCASPSESQVMPSLERQTWFIV